MLLRRPDPPADDAPLSARTRSLSWTALLTDVVVVALMARSGSALDNASPLLSMITLGGHHRVVLGLALAGLLLFAGLAPGTQGFVRAGPTQRVLLPVAATFSLAAVAGLAAVVALAGAVLAAAALLFRPIPRTRVDLVRRWR